MPSPKSSAAKPPAAKPVVAKPVAVKPAAAAIPRLVQLSCQALDDKKAMELHVLDVTGLSTITNYLIIATATSAPHLKALRYALESVLDEEKVKMAGVDFSAESGWLVFDAFEFMAHLFLPEQRDNYRLESLWKDARPIDVRPLLK